MKTEEESAVDEEWRVRSEEDAVDYEKKESAVDEESKIELWREKQKTVDDGKKRRALLLLMKM
jgi:hypothetical protein